VLEPDELVDHFRVVRLIGRGGMGEVYLARDTRLGRRVALKVVNPTRLGTTGAVERFIDEARTTARFNHPHIVTVYAVGEHDGRPYIALEYLEGRSLKQRMRQEMPSYRESLRIGLAIAKALEEAHRNSVLHRDLKPENVLIPLDGRVRVVDFGLAMQIPGDIAPRLSSSGAAPSVRLPLDEATSSDLSAAEQNDTLDEIPYDDQDTEVVAQGAPQQGSGSAGVRVLGTPHYMAPEQWHGQEISGATDIWALGVILYELVAKCRPCEETSVLALASRVTAPEPLPPIEDHVEVPIEFAELVGSCLAKISEERPSAAEVGQVLTRMVYRLRGPVTGEESPYRGLLPFGERHAPFFFGRESEIAAFVERLREEPVIPVVGLSGAGKSSFVQAGVIPRLREQGPWIVVHVRPGERPFQALASSLRSIEPLRRRSAKSGSTHEMRPPQEGRGRRAPPDEEATSLDDRGLADLLSASPHLLALKLQEMAEEAKAKVLLFVDQLEEVYTLAHDEKTRQRFMQAICAAADDRHAPVRVVFTLRDDFLCRLEVRAEAREALSRVVVLRKPSFELLEEVLCRPLEAVGYRYDDPQLVPEMIAAVRGEPACLPMLQFTAQVLWDRRDKVRHLLRREDYEQVGGVVGALADHADGVLQGLSPGQVALTRQLLLRLVTAEGTRRVLARAEALEGLGEGAEVVLSRLHRARLISVWKGEAGQDADASLELIHESLIRVWGQLARWLDESRDEVEFLAEIGQAAELWQKRGRRDEEVWHGDALLEAQRKRTRMGGAVPQLIDAFLDAGEQRQRRLARRRRYLWVAAATALTLVTVASLIVAMTLADKERQARQHGEALREQWAVAQREGARAALVQGDLLEARAKLRGSLESRDSAFARALWRRLNDEPLIWRRVLKTGVYDVAFGPDGQTVAVACQDKAIHLFDAVTAAEQVLRGHDDQVVSITFSPDGTRLAAGDGGGGLWIWDLEARSVSRLAGHKETVWGLAFSPDGKQLASGSWDKTVRIWQVESGTQLRVLAGHDDAIWSVAFSPDGRLLASSSSDATIRLWDLTAAADIPPKVLKGHADAVAAVSFDPGGKRLVSGGSDTTLRIWEVATGAQQAVLRGHTDRVRDVVFSPSGSRVASAGADSSILVWDLATRQVDRVYSGHTSAVSALSFAPDGARLASVADDSTVRVWSISTKAANEPDQGHGDGASDVAFDPTGRRLASSGFDQTVRLWDVGSGEQLRVLEGHSEDVYRLGFSPDGQRLASSSYDKTVRIWDLASGTTQALLSGHSAMVDGVAFSPDGKLVATGSYDKTVGLWDARTGKQLKVLRGHSGWVTGVAFSPDGRSLASGSFDGSVRIWSVASGELLQKLDAADGEIYAVAFSPDGRKLIAGADRRLRLWDLARGEGTPFSELGSRTYRVSFSPDGGRIGSANADGKARIWDLAARLQVEIAGHVGEANGFSFGPDGDLVATAGDDGTVRLWQASSGLPRWSGPLLHRASRQLLTHGGWVALDKRSSGGPAAGARWQLQVAQTARRAVDDGAQQLCVQTLDDAVELWDTARDQRLFRRPLADVRELLATGEGCVARSRLRVRRYDRSGNTADLDIVASAMAWHRGNLLLAVENEIQRFDSAGQLVGRYEADIGVTAMLPTERWLVLGFTEGSVELIPWQAGAERPALSFEAVPASAVTRMIEGPGDTVVIGFATGLVGIWSLRDGSRFSAMRIHGPVEHLLLHDSMLYAATSLGAHSGLDIGIFQLGYCELMRSVWDSVDTVWEDGRPVATPSPTAHVCTPR